MPDDTLIHDTFLWDTFYEKLFLHDIITSETENTQFGFISQALKCDYGL